MTPLAIALIVLGALVGLAILAYGVAIVRTVAATRRPMPIDTGGEARRIAEGVRLGEDAAWPALEVWGPPGDPAGRARPVVVLVPGDGPDVLLKRANGWKLWRSYADLCAARGWSTVVLGHRSSGNYRRSETMVADVVRGLGLLRARADTWGLDPDRMVVWCFSGSSGPVLAHLLRQPVPGLCGLLSFYGVLDLGTYLMKPPEAVVARYSLPPVLAGAETLPCPVHLVHAGRDQAMIRRGYERTVAALRGRNLPVAVRVAEGARHGFDLVGDPAQVREEVDRALAFVETCFAEHA